MEIVWAVILVLVLLISWATNLFGFPGNWVMIAAALVYWVYMPPETRLAFHWGVLVAMAVLATLGEVVELAAGAAGAAKAGGSKRGAVLALLGSLAGGMLGLFAGVLIPIPILGPLVATLVCASLGAMGGAVLGERWKGRPMEEGLKVGEAAFWGRLWGTLGKIVCGAVMLAVALLAMVV